MGRPATIKVEYKGELMTISELMAYSSVSEIILRTRLFKLGWSVEKALTTDKVVGRLPSAATAKKGRKAKKYELFAHCAARCNAK